MLDFPSDRFGRGGVEFAVYIDRKSPCGGRCHSEMRPDIGNHLLFCDGHVAVGTGPDAEMGVVEVEIELAGSAEKAVVIIDDGRELHPGFEGKSAIECEIGVEI